jgi:DNA-formamidopyrimidine glycosylase
MPEGVEVSLFSRSLNQFLQNKTITKVEVLSGRYTKKPIEGLSQFQTQLPLQIDKVNNKGKFIYLTFKNHDAVMYNTLGMTGGWTTIPTKHERVRFEVKDQNEKIESLYFRDIRNFGTLHFKTQTELQQKLKTIGYDFIQEYSSLSQNEFYQILMKYPNKNICELLMRQDIISGVGNYIKAEALWFADIHPNAIMKNLNYQDICNLYDGLKLVTDTAFAAGGATIKDYFRFNNWERTINFFKVYDKKIDPLGNPIIKTETLDGRTTHWAPAKQIKGV